MVATLPELHGKIADARTIKSLLLVTVQKLYILFVESAVVLLLENRQLDLDQSFFLWRNRFLYILLQQQRVNARHESGVFLSVSLRTIKSNIP